MTAAVVLTLMVVVFCLGVLAGLALRRRDTVASVARLVRLAGIMDEEIPRCPMS